LQKKKLNFLTANADTNKQTEEKERERVVMVPNDLRITGMASELDIEEKEKQLYQYYQLTKAILHAFAQRKEDEVPELLQQREACIAIMNEVDKTAGELLMNDQMKALLRELLPMEERIQAALRQVMQELKNRVREVRNETFLSKQYENRGIIPTGVFYDKKN
jgi:hypothetical protein